MWNVWKLGSLVELCCFYNSKICKKIIRWLIKCILIHVFKMFSLYLLTWKDVHHILLNEKPGWNDLHQWFHIYLKKEIPPPITEFCEWWSCGSNFIFFPYRKPGVQAPFIDVSTPHPTAPSPTDLQGTSETSSIWMHGDVCFWSLFHCSVFLYLYCASLNMVLW